MKKHKVVIMVFIAINILMNSAAYNSFDSYCNAQMDDFSVIDEGVGDAIRSGILAGMLSFSPFSGQAADKAPEKVSTPIVQAEKTYSGFTATQATNIIARTLYMEARSEGEAGIDAVASVISNRAGGKAEKLPIVCLKKYQFSCWNGSTTKTPTLYKAIVPSAAVKQGPNRDMWQYCEKTAGKLLDGTFKSTIGKRNAYHTLAVTPNWDEIMQDKTTIGNHVFGYLPEYDGSIVKVKPNKPANKPKITNKPPAPVSTSTQKYTIQSGDQLGKIALKFNTTTNRLLALNPKYKNNPNLIKVGDKITVPRAK